MKNIITYVCTFLLTVSMSTSLHYQVLCNDYRPCEIAEPLYVIPVPGELVKK